MSHTCPDCQQYCFCDGDDTYIETESETCDHECAPEDIEGDFEDWPRYECYGCEDNGCALCLGDEATDEPSDRGDRKAIDEALVRRLF